MSETQTQTLAAWLLERIAEDEDRARHRRRIRPEFVERRVSGDADGVYVDGMLVDPDTVWERYEVEPRRRDLAECEAKRRIVELAGTPDPHAAGEGCPECEVLYLLALPYADHPTYREEWRP